MEHRDEIARVRVGLPARAMLVALFAWSAACNVVAMKQSSIERTMRGAGLLAADRRIGADTVHYWAGGHGPTVVLVHGFGGSGMWLWYPQVENLAHDHRVIVPDLLWFGESTSDQRDFGIDHQVHAVESLLDQLGERQVDVVGVSYGGLVAHEIANDRADQVRRLVLVDTPGRVYTHADYRSLCQRFGVSSFGDVLVPLDARGVTRLLNLAYFDPPWVPHFALMQTLHGLFETYRAEKVALLDTLLDTMDSIEARPVTRRAPALVIWGRQDTVFPLEIGERLASSLGAPLEIVENARHAPNLEHPDAFNRTLRRFLVAN